MSLNIFCYFLFLFYVKSGEIYYFFHGSRSLTQCLVFWTLWILLIYYCFDRDEWVTFSHYAIYLLWFRVILGSSVSFSAPLFLSFPQSLVSVYLPCCVALSLSLCPLLSVHLSRPLLCPLTLSLHQVVCLSLHLSAFPVLFW